MPTFTVSGRKFEVDHDLVESCLANELPDPIHEHYVVVCGRRFPPKQVLCVVTGLDRADFTTHQARRILMRVGFTAARAHGAEQQDATSGGDAPQGGGQADALRPYLGKWVALAGPTEVLVAADSPQEVLRWLAEHERRAVYGMFRVPTSVREAEGLAPA
jgi:hypothetical protein